MQQAGGRRIKRSLFIDASGVRFMNAHELEPIHLLSDYVAHKKAELQRSNTLLGEVAEHPANRRQLTNLGTLRAYVLAYLRQHPDIQPNMTCMVRQLQPTAQGIPLEIYCFTQTTDWSEYERVQGDIFDYLLAVLPAFGLAVYQQPSGGDMRQGWMQIAEPS